MTESKLPPLPQGYGSIPWDYRAQVYTESQMKAYGDVCFGKSVEMKDHQLRELVNELTAISIKFYDAGQLRLQEKAYPRTCAVCGLGKCERMLS